jgi:hypothetical protein
MNLPWDSYSDQPHIIKDKALKKTIYKQSTLDQIITLLTTILLSPFVALSYLLFQTKRDIDTTKFFSIGVNLDKNPKESLDLINELGVDSLLVRFPLNDIENIDKYVEFVESFKDKEIVINILQDRENISNLDLFEKNITLIFESFKDIKEFQIANAINRKKWAFWKMSEYLRFFEVAQRVRDKKFKDIKLLGSSVIDFEYHYTIRSLFNLYPIKYDKFTSLLYVDRRGDPQNSQMGFNLRRKINLLNAIISINPKTKNNLYITETNWPLSNTAPYAPTSEKECVSEDDYAFYMVIYYLIALSTNQVDRVFWHQLIAPGYGLVDNRDGIKKYPAFYAYKTMVTLLKGAVLKEFNLNSEVKFFRFKNKKKSILIYWGDNLLDIQGDLDIYGDKFKSGRFTYIINS